MAIIASSATFAEYRAYQYLVVDKISKDKSSNSIIVSSLDPVTYISYNGGSNLVNVDLLRTWICPGHTGKKEVCPSPYSELPEEFLQ